MQAELIEVTQDDNRIRLRWSVDGELVNEFITTNAQGRFTGDSRYRAVFLIGIALRCFGKTVVGLPSLEIFRKLRGFVFPDFAYGMPTHLMKV